MHRIFVLLELAKQKSHLDNSHVKLKNFFIKGLLKALQPIQSRSTIHGLPRSFLIVSTTGLGDTLWAIPAVRSLRSSYPDSFIALLTTSLGEQVLSRNRAIDELFILEEPFLWSGLQLIPSLRKQKFDAVLLFHSSQRFILPLCTLCDVPQIIGTKGLQKDLDFLLTQAIEQRPSEHEIARRLAIVQAVGAHSTMTELEFPLHQLEEQTAMQFLQALEIPDYLPIIGLHPGAKDVFKQWPPSCFVEVGRRLTQHIGCRVIVSGDEKEAQLVYTIASQIPGAIPLAGDLTIGSFAALLKRYSLFITNDTGPMHLAFAMKTPTVALFGPTDPKICGPWHAPNTEVVARSKTCFPCLRKKCEEPFCLLQISPAEVYDRALSLFFTTRENE